MLYDLANFRAELTREYGVSDITVVMGVRLHAKNPWVIERLSDLAGYYQPAPRVLIVDFGSAEPFRAQLAEVCRTAGFELLVVDEAGLFSPARARNLGAASVRTELVFFSDVDCTGERSLFARLIEFANAMDMGARFDLLIDLPVYHLSKQTTAAIAMASTADERSRALGKVLAQGPLSAPQALVEYVDPQSNFFLIRRDFFDYSGGFNESFRGHGSEDFEFLLRLAASSLQYPIPDDIGADGVLPGSPAFYGQKAYAGFRRMFELMCEPAQLAGLRIAHLHHERRRDDTGWYEQNDWSRQRFSAAVLTFLRDRAELLHHDWLPREHSALVLIDEPTDVDLFLPLRLAGFRLLGARMDAEGLSRARALLEGRKVQSVFVRESTLAQHGELAELLAMARTHGLAVTTIERGVLPESLHFAGDDSQQGAAPRTLSEDAFTANQLAVADAYLEKLREFDTASDLSGRLARAAGAAPGTPPRLSLAWLIWRQYSFARAQAFTAAQSEQAHPGSVLWYQVQFAGRRITALRNGLDLRVPPHCYLTSRMGVGELIAERGPQAYDWSRIDASAHPRARRGSTSAKLDKLLRDPQRFFQESRHIALRVLARAVPGEASPALRRLRKLYKRRD
jgi:predicted glycosyltransferase involved in capsule biosynthesis